MGDARGVRLGTGKERDARLCVVTKRSPARGAGVGGACAQFRFAVRGKLVIKSCIGLYAGNQLLPAYWPQLSQLNSRSFEVFCNEEQIRYPIVCLCCRRNNYAALGSNMLSPLQLDVPICRSKCFLSSMRPSLPLVARLASLRSGLSYLVLKWSGCDVDSMTPRHHDAALHLTQRQVGAGRVNGILEGKQLHGDLLLQRHRGAQGQVPVNLEALPLFAAPNLAFRNNLY